MYVIYTLFSLSSAWVLDFLAAGKSGESHCTGKQSALSKSHRITTKFVINKLLPAKVLAPQEVEINNDPSIPRINHKVTSCYNAIHFKRYR